MAKVDAPFARNAARASKAEITLGTLAQTNAASPEVKAFGERMITDHTKAYDELAKVAASKGVVVPSDPSPAQMRTAARLQKMSGAAFDRQFIKVMVADHKKSVSLFRNEATNGRDAEMKALAAATLPTLEGHLKMAQQLAANPQARM